MGFSNGVRTLAHDAMHRLPGMPDHARAGELNSHQSQGPLRSRPQGNRPMGNRPLGNRPMGNRPLSNRPMRNPDDRHARPPRLFAGWQAWLGQRFQQGQR